MRSLAITDSSFANQREAVKEERRLRVDNQPYSGAIFEGMYALADSVSCFPYSHSIIGSMADLNAASVDDVLAFFKMYYAPNNAVVGIVGDIDTKTTLAKMEKYFGAIPKQPAPPQVDMSEPPQTEERRLTLEDALARLPRLDMAYKIPPSSSPDTDALSVLGTILSGGRSSRFYESIVRQKQLSSGVGAGTDGSRGPGLFAISAVAMPGKTLSELEAAIDQETERVKTAPIEDWEIEKARIGVRRSVVSGLGSSFTRAYLLSEDAMFFDDPDRINTRVDRIAKVTAADVQRVARQYLVKTNRSVVLTTPKAAGPKGGQG